MTLAPSFASPHVHAYPYTRRNCLLPIRRKSLRNRRFLFISPSTTLFASLPTSSSFSIKSVSNPVRFHPLPDSIHDDFIEDLENSLASFAPVNGVHQIESPELSSRIFIPEPPWFSSLFLKGLYSETSQEFKLEFKDIEKRKYNLLRRRQIKAETEAWERMVEEYRELEKEMCEKNLAPNLPKVKALFLGWFDPLKEAIEAEQKLQRSKKNKAAAYAPHIDLLPASKMAVIVMHKMMGLVMQELEMGCVRVVQAAVQIGTTIEQEVRIQRFLEKTRRHNSKKAVAGSEDDLNNDKEKIRKRLNGLIRRKRMKEVQLLLKKEEFSPWGRDAQAKLGCRLIQLLIETAYLQAPADQSADAPPDIRPAFSHRVKAIPKYPGKKAMKNCGVIECDPLLLAGLDESAKNMLIPYMPMLIPPKKWKGYDKGGHLFLPSYIMRTHGSRKQQNVMKNVEGKQMHKVYEALDTLGETKWRINKKLHSVVESIWAGGGNIAGLVDRNDVPVPEKPSVEDLKLIQEWKWSARKARKINLERHSQRCDVELKLSVAQRMKDEEEDYLNLLKGGHWGSLAYIG
ncbi:hypothetical protein K1719_003489 [Acacia pycnantha]|nr:hypothetical protein K1719_003489 [Acacia pycnantha]